LQVPIIKLTDRLTNIKVDVSVNQASGIRAAELVKLYKKCFPALPKLVYILKQFLMQRDLNEVFSGGLSSYALLLMVVSFLQLHPSAGGCKGRSSDVNAGHLLLEFLKLYGNTLNFHQVGIRVKNGGQYVRKADLLRELEEQKDNAQGPAAYNQQVSHLGIEDPTNPGNDVGRSSYGAPRVLEAFKQAHSDLSQALEDTERRRGRVPLGGSLLSSVVQVSEDMYRFRKWADRVQPPEKFPHFKAADLPRPTIPMPLELSDAEAEDTFSLAAGAVEDQKSDSESNVSLDRRPPSTSSDGDSDLLLCGSVSRRKMTSSKASQSPMSISPAGSEVGNALIKGNKSGRRFNGVASSSDSSISSSLKGKHWREGQQDRADLDFNWRARGKSAVGPDQDSDWRSKEKDARGRRSPVRAQQSGKKSNTKKANNGE